MRLTDDRLAVARAVRDEFLRSSRRTQDSLDMERIIAAIPDPTPLPEPERCNDVEDGYRCLNELGHDVHHGEGVSWCRRTVTRERLPEPTGPGYTRAQAADELRELVRAAMALLETGDGERLPAAIRRLGEAIVPFSWALERCHCGEVSVQGGEIIDPFCPIHDVAPPTTPGGEA